MEDKVDGEYDTHFRKRIAYKIEREIWKREYYLLILCAAMYVIS
jgi:hypothetical protein